MRHLILGVSALVLPAALGGGAALAADTPYRGLADYRTGGGKYRYEPVVVVPAAVSAPEVAARESAHRLRVRSLAFLTGETAPRAEDVLAAASEVVFAILRPAEPPELRARFDEDMARLAAAPCAILLGLRGDDAEVPYSLVLDSKGRALGSTVFTPPPAELQKWIDAASTYARLGRSRTLDFRLWSEVRSIAVPEIRFQAMVDVLAASYRGLFRRQPIATRVGLVREIVQAMGSDLTPERWLRLHFISDAWDRDDAMLQETLGGAHSRWLAAAGASDDRVAALALGVAAEPYARTEVTSLAPQIVGAFLGRGRPIGASSLRTAASVLEAVPTEGQTVEPRAVEALVRGLSRAESLVTEPNARDAFWTLVALAAGRLPPVREALRSSPEADARIIRSALQKARAEPTRPAALDELERLLGPR